jgi:hypothetical protein
MRIHLQRNRKLRTWHDELADVADAENLVHAGELLQLRQGEVGREDAPAPPAHGCRADSRVAAVRRSGRVTWSAA